MSLIEKGRALATYFGPDLANNPIAEGTVNELVDALDALTPRTVTTVEELDAMPQYSVIRIMDGIVLEKMSRGYYRPGVDRPLDPFDFWFPATVLYAPDA